MGEKTKELKYEWVYMQEGDSERIVRISEVSKADRGKKFYLKDKDNSIHKVHMVLCDKRRSHFRLNPIFKGDNKDGDDKIEVKPIDYAETLIHDLTKQLLVDREIRQIWLPDLHVDDGDFAFKARSGRLVKVIQANKEVVYSDLGVRVDIEIEYEDFESSTNTSKVAMEVYVTHSINNDKLNRLWNGRLNTIELDLHDLYGDKTLANANLIDDIIERLTAENENLYWVYNSDKFEIADKLRRHVVVIDCDRNNYNIDTEGKWRNYVDSLRWKGVKNCPYKDMAIKMSKGGPYLPESTCSKCPRFIKCKVTNTDIGPQYRMYCNQVECEVEDVGTISRLIDNIVK